jgi:peptide/nickel transport system permease protein
VLRLILIRACLGLLTLWAASLVVFLGTQLLPGDAAQAALGQQATPQLVAALRKDLGLDRPVLVRYGEWLGGFVRGDFGLSMPSKEPVANIIGDRIRNTGVLALITVAVLVPLSLFLGILSAVQRDRVFDHAVAGVTLALISTPEFVVGSLLALVLAVKLGWLPPASLIDSAAPVLPQWPMFVLPVLTLLAAEVAQTTRMIRATMIEVLDSDYVMMARLKGVPESRVLLWHALPNALAPTLQVLAFIVAWLTGGVVVVEYVFQFPGLGLGLASAVASRDQPTVEAITMLITGLYVAANLLADIGVIALNPRLQLKP